MGRIVDDLGTPVTDAEPFDRIFFVAGFRTSCPTAPACKVADRYVNQEGRPIVTDTPGAVRSRVQCGTTAGHMSSGSEPEAPEQATDLRFLSWGV
jgi:hypothetical protein